MIDLFSYQDLEYKYLIDKLLKNDNIKTIGIRTPVLKKLSKSLIKGDYSSYINNSHIYYEEVLIHGFIIGYIDIPFDKRLLLLDNFIPLVNNWAVNDMVCANLHCFKTNQEEGFKYIKKLLKGNEWSIRFGTVLLLDYYINDNYIDKLTNICLSINNDNYYVKMGVSWLLSTMYIKYPKETLEVIMNDKLDNWIKRKTISKICDSYKVNKTDKEYLKTLR